jgi:protocatechuate 3,4-dioxygenase beta subunit
LEAIKNAPDLPPADQALFAASQLTDIEEIVFSPAGGAAIVLKSVPPVMTNSEGGFEFDNVEPGTYKLMFSAPGYARQDYGEGSFGGTGTPIVLAGGQTKRDIIMRMSPVSAVSGRISDAVGHAIAGVPVQLFHLSYDDSAHKKTQRVASAQTDDRGEYRFYFLSPGRYYLGAGHQTGQARPAGSQPEGGPFGMTYLSPNRIPQNYTFTYYPGVAEVNAATAIDVQAGADLGGIDLLLGPQKTYRVRGRVVDSRTGQPPQSAFILLQPQSTDLADFVTFMSGGNSQNYNPQDGTFEIRNVAPGSYKATVELPNPSPARPPDIAGMSAAERQAYFAAQAAEQQTRPRGSMSIGVTNSDLDGITITVGATGSISGRIQIRPSGVDSAIRFESLRVQLRSEIENGAGTNRPDSGAVKSDGTFLMKGVPPGEYRLSVMGIPAGSYVKEARYGQTDVLNTPLRFSGNDSNSLDIVISPNAGQIDGNAVNARDQATPGVQVVLIPDSNRSRTELFRPVTADAVGHFSIPTVVPGDYKIVAWNAMEPFAFFDPEFIKLAEQNGKPVRVTESSKQTVTLNAW